MPAIDIDRNAAHEAAQRELAKPVYPSASPTQRFHDWVHQLLNHLLQTGASVPGGWFSVVVLLTVLAAAVAAAIHTARRSIRTSRGVEHPLFGTSQLSAAQHRAAADEAAAQGDWAAAIRHRLRAVARQLEDSGVLAASPGRTAGELAQDAGNRLPHLAFDLRAAAGVFNDVAYGDEPGSSAGYTTITDLDDHLRSRPPAGCGPASQPAAIDVWTQVQ